MRGILRTLLGGLLLATPAAAAAPEPADLVFWGGPIHTAEEATPTVEAVAVRAGRIVHAGPRAGAQALVGPTTQVVDLRGAALFPGFTDAHMHLDGVGQRALSLDLSTEPSLASLLATVAARVARQPPGSLLTGGGWIETHWPEKRFPTRQDLDAVAPDLPVLLTRADGHALVANSAALRAAGIDADTVAPEGGEILRDAEGRPTGMLIDTAMSLVAGLRREPTVEERRRAYAEGAALYARLGWTGVHTMGTPLEDVPIQEALLAEGALPLRVYNLVRRIDGERLVAEGPRQSGDGRIVTRGVKLFADGALGSRGAALLEPYADAPGRGLVLLAPAETAPFLAAALKSGIQVATHAIGDRANRLVLDAYEAAFAAVPAGQRALAEPRWRVEHAQIVAPADRPRFATLGVIASMQPSHAIGDLHFAPARLGPESARLGDSYAWRSLLESGALVAGGSDAPVEVGDPRIEFYAAVARRDLAGFSGPGWHPEQALDRQAALRLFTLAPAYAAFQERDLGSIAVGKKADLTVFSADLMTVPVEEIPKARALLTVVDGTIAYRAEGW